MTVSDAVVFFTAPDAPHRHKSYPVVDEGTLIGMAARAARCAGRMSGLAG